MKLHDMAALKMLKLMWKLVVFLRFSSIKFNRWRYEIWRSDTEKYGDQSFIFLIRKEILIFNANFSCSI